MTATTVTRFQCDICLQVVETTDPLPTGWKQRRPGYGVSDTHICSGCLEVEEDRPVVASSALLMGPVADAFLALRAATQAYVSARRQAFDRLVVIPVAVVHRYERACDAWIDALETAIETEIGEAQP